MATKRMTAQNHYAAVIPELTKTKKCRVCGKRFQYYPQYHAWKARVNGSALEFVCSYTCMRKIERREAERLSKYMLPDFEDGEENNKDERRPIVRDKAMTVESLRVKLQSAEDNYKELDHEIFTLRHDGAWPHMPQYERNQKVKRRNYWRRRSEALEKELELLTK